MSTMQKGPGGSSNSHRDPYDLKAAEDKAKSSPKRGPRHVTGQLPLVRSATVYPPDLGLVYAPIMLDDECACGGWHRHQVKWPAPVLLSRRARCGVRYELALHRPKVKRGKAVA